VDRTVGKPWIDRVKDYRDLLAWSEAAGTLPVMPARLARGLRERATEADAALARARETREALFRIFSAVAAAAQARGGRPRAAERRARPRAGARASGAERGGLRLGVGRRAPSLELPLWPLVRSAAELLTSPERRLVRRCASETCLWLFLDRTKNHARRWCDMKVCGNRAKVRRHRRRARR
jgi:predicted RNA-binding Zn ribbon-like protein